MINGDKLMAVMWAKQVSVKEVCGLLGISRATFYRKLSRKDNTFTVIEAAKLKERLNMSDELFNEIFLPTNSQK